MTVADNSRNRSKKVPCETFWQDAWAGPKEQPPSAKPNTLFAYDVELLSLRNHGFYNFMGIMVIDLEAFSESPEDQTFRKLLKENVIVTFVVDSNPEK